jgi:hypothetical protein
MNTVLRMIGFFLATAAAFCFGQGAWIMHPAPGVSDGMTLSITFGLVALFSGAVTAMAWLKP